ncbi:MAG: hypothetical protein PPHEINF_2631 [uncultured Paraburkholderia sp.]|nr:MAG: hypothetical protein PPHEINF_2631 [uncultured Paraburkholderia sp.]CAH2789695.1 MAG: hypothetical protein PPHEESC_2748 [uncultured Paraburkholderia sp.]CAH2923700.1 MAG: hypothetical protein PPHEMADMSA_2651 [uncultured Paraburkholderia sp.]CAH2924716.1 MAG: hypothetical protein PPHERAN_2667 [uncultured Paraburkholderia sp.]
MGPTGVPLMGELRKTNSLAHSPLETLPKYYTAISREGQHSAGNFTKIRDSAPKTCLQSLLDGSFFCLGRTLSFAAGDGCNR